MKIDIPTPGQIRSMIKEEALKVIDSIRNENFVLRRKVRGLEESIKVISIDLDHIRVWRRKNVRHVDPHNSITLEEK